VNRAAIRARVFPLGERKVNDLSADTTPAERLALLADLTRETWALSNREIPVYARSEMPVTVIHHRNREE
jgi:hypothetical protein